MSPRLIWQYWETRDFKPPFVDGLLEIARRNAGVDIQLVTPENIYQFLPDIPADVFKINEMAHKADMIRAMLIYRHGGMWLDSDAIVLSDLNWLFNLLDDFEFIGFNDSGHLESQHPNIRINCFLARPNSSIVGRWVCDQHLKFPRTTYSWTEVGTDLLDPIIVTNQQNVKLLPFHMICPIPWDQVQRFSSPTEDTDQLLQSCSIVMLSNKSLQTRNQDVARMPMEELATGNSLIAKILRIATLKTSA